MLEWEYCTVIQRLAPDGTAEGHSRLAYGSRGSVSRPRHLAHDVRNAAAQLSLEGWELVGAERLGAHQVGSPTEVAVTFRRLRGSPGC